MSLTFFRLNPALRTLSEMQVHVCSVFFLRESQGHYFIIISALLLLFFRKTLRSMTRHAGFPYHQE